MSTQAIIDDYDPSVQYFSGWVQDANSPGSFHSTLHSPSAVGATATLSFSGTGIEVHGVVIPSKQRQRPTDRCDTIHVSRSPAGDPQPALTETAIAPPPPPIPDAPLNLPSRTEIERVLSSTMFLR
ncbi:hypothetical protein L226DRAFT_617639 [Lentinus tigrinus ALCF2SS1-7]|uniref:uncharacterized protein n=1 Tax=Lentinus tigrinus ALCF2SS1-7 TaxID=1328758 RepID=UPI00116633BA|nr:hypothetical protein L226DRAFT_617639 [Lentinus tigrinus ALCF2SS1-7]